MTDLRTERTFGVTAELKPRQRQHLSNLLNSEVYPDLLDVMEMVCIEHESRLINTDPAKQDEVLANHRMAKAAWQMFVHIQQKISEESARHLRSIEKPIPIRELTPQEQFEANVLDPMQPAPSEEESWITNY